MLLKSPWNTWFRSSRKTRAGAPWRRRSVAAPWAAEVLEERQLLSSITVTTLADNTTAGDGQITLREALLAANTNASVDGSVAGEAGVQDTIRFQAGLAGRLELDAALGPLVISGSVRIEGTGAARLATDAKGLSRVFDVQAGAGDVAFVGLTITGGRTDASAVAGAGAGIRAATSGTVTLQGVELTDNITAGAAAHGAGLYAGAGSVVVLSSTVAENAALGVGSFGGGIYITTGTAVVTNSTISGNEASGGGGLFSQAADVTLTNSTVTNNSADDGGGLSLFNGSLTLRNSIVAGNDASVAADDIRFTNSGTLKTAVAANSLIGINAGTPFAPSPGGAVADVQGNFIGTLVVPIDARLGGLGGNGGETRTHALLNGSLALNSGANALALEPGGLALTFDQRGSGSARIDGTVDMGSFELHAANPLLIVTTANDELDADLSNPDDLSLREAIFLTNMRPGHDTIVFDARLSGVPINLTLGQLAIMDSLTITGHGAGRTVIDARAGSRAIDIFRGAFDVTLNGVTVTQGRVTGFLEAGAGIRTFSTGTLRLNDSEITLSRVVDTRVRGGAIYSENGDLVLTDSLIANNWVEGDFSSAGGIFSHTGNVTIINSTLSGNMMIGTTVNGSALVTASASAGITLVNSTVTANISDGDAGSRGAVVSLRGDINLANSIVAGNTIDGFGTIDVSFANMNGTATFAARNSILGVNTDTPLAGTGGTVGANGNFVGTSGAPFNPQLGPLAKNGGATRTHALLQGSAAINAGSNVLAAGVDGLPLLTDQRGGLFLRIVNTTVDIGAFEAGNVQAGFDQMLALEGFYFDSGNLAVVMRAGAELSLKNGAGVMVSGEVIDSTHISTGFGNLNAEFNAQAGTLVFANGTVWNKVPNLGGVWIDDSGDQVLVGQVATDLSVRLEGGVKLNGAILSPTQVTVNGVVGTLTNDRQRIVFNNGDVWELVPHVQGGYSNSSDQPVAIVQSGIRVRIVQENGLVSNGHFVNQNTILATDWGLTATVNLDGSISWSHGDLYRPEPVTGTNVEIGGVYDVRTGGSARILQADDKLTIINEVGASLSASFVSSTEIVVDSTGVRGFISGNTILWTDGKVYTHIPDLSGPYIDLLGNETRVGQLGRDLIFTSSAGVVTHGRITSSTHFTETDGAMRTGTISGGVLLFSDGTVWADLPDLRGNWVQHSTGNPTFIAQAGASALLVTDLGALIHAHLLSPNVFVTNLALGGSGALGSNVAASISGNDFLYFNNGWFWRRPAPSELDAVFADPATLPFV
jgi:CSLREA domain-containing protein